MIRSFSALMLGIFLGTASPVSLASETAEPAPDPNKKKAGEACTTSDECQKHHTCAKVGDKNVCQAPPRARLPPGAVT